MTVLFRYKYEGILITKSFDVLDARLINDEDEMVSGPSDAVFIYVVHGVFVSSSEIEEAISRDPNSTVNSFDRDNYVKEMALFAAETLSKSLNSAQPLTVVRIISAQTQVALPGMNYKMELELKKGKKKSINCHVVVWDRNWNELIHPSLALRECSCCGSSWKSIDNRPTTTTTTISSSIDEEASIINETAIIKEDEKEMTDAPAPIDGDVSGD